MVSGPVRALACLLMVVCSGLRQTPAAAETNAAGSEASSGAHKALLDKNGVLILVRSSLVAVSQANQTGNYTVLRDLGSPEFQQINTAARLGEIFKPLRDQHLDLSASVVLEPQLTLLPQIEKNGRLHMAGFFPSVPLQVYFDLALLNKEGRWMIDTISVSLASSAPTGSIPLRR